MKTPRAHRASVVPDVKPLPQEVTEIYVAIADLETGDGIYCVQGADGQNLPVVAFDESGIAALSQYAREQARETGRTVRIVGFSQRIDYETFHPSKLIK